MKIGYLGTTFGLPGQRIIRDRTKKNDQEPTAYSSRTAEVSSLKNNKQNPPPVFKGTIIG